MPRDKPQGAGQPRGTPTSPGRSLAPVWVSFAVGALAACCWLLQAHFGGAALGSATQSQPAPQGTTRRQAEREEGLPAFLRGVRLVDTQLVQGALAAEGIDSRETCAPPLTPYYHTLLFSVARGAAHELMCACAALVGCLHSTTTR